MAAEIEAAAHRRRRRHPPQAILLAATLLLIALTAATAASAASSSPSFDWNGELHGAAACSVQRPSRKLQQLTGSGCASGTHLQPTLLAVSVASLALLCC